MHSAGAGLQKNFWKFCKGSGRKLLSSSFSVIQQTQERNCTEKRIPWQVLCCKFCEVFLRANLDTTHGQLFLKMYFLSLGILLTGNTLGMFTFTGQRPCVWRSTLHFAITEESSTLIAVAICHYISLVKWLPFHLWRFIYGKCPVIFWLWHLPLSMTEYSRSVRVCGKFSLNFSSGLILRLICRMFLIEEFRVSRASKCIFLYSSFISMSYIE